MKSEPYLVSKEDCITCGVPCLAKNYAHAGLSKCVHCHGEFAICWVPTFATNYSVLHHGAVITLVNKNVI